MKRFLKFLIVSVIIVFVAFAVFEFSGKYRMSILGNNISWSIDAKNCKNSIGFDKDQEGNTYIAYKNSIKEIKKDGREELLLQERALNIENLLYDKNNLYFISDDKLYKHDLNNKELKIILEKIPSKGKFLDRNLIIKDSKLLLSIGTATNSGVAYDDGNCNFNKIPYDKTPINITLNGLNYGSNETGAFMPYGNSCKEGEKIKSEELGNASVVEINLNNNKFSLYACGIRNIKGWDLDSENRLIGIVGGMENKGERAINRDFDYLYNIEKGKWYGWPDFSGGDPISSPRFKGEKIVSPIIANPPNKIVSAPLYQYSNQGIIRYLAIDKEGKILDKDTKVFYDSEQNIISSINLNGNVYKLLKLKPESNIKGIKYSGGEFYILDSGIGTIYKLQCDNSSVVFNLPKSIWIFIISFCFVLLCISIVKINRGYKGNKKLNTKQ